MTGIERSTEGGRILWEPSSEFKASSRIMEYMEWLANSGITDIKNRDYHSLWNWSVQELSSFWKSIWDYFEIMSTHPFSQILQKRSNDVFGSKWFQGSRLNYCEHAFRSLNERKISPTDEAIIGCREDGSKKVITWQDLQNQVASFSSALHRMGVVKGDRVVAFAPNIPETIISFLATARIGAIWSSCSPDFGVPSVVDRFKQLEPKILIATDGYSYNGKSFGKIEAITELQSNLTTIKETILIPYLHNSTEKNSLSSFKKFHEIIKDETNHSNLDQDYAQVSFEHPLWILFSSGTTGPPKAIVQSHGGILLEHLKLLALQMNLGDRDRFFWFTTTGWMMWNVLVSGLLVGSTIIAYDGSPSYPDLSNLWRLAEDVGIKYFGTSAAFLSACNKAGIRPKDVFKFKDMSSIGSTGSPLTPEGFEWVYENIKEDIWLNSVSGGTDVCTAFLGGSPILPVISGEIQCRSLGAKVEAYNENGQSVIGEVGELVVTEPLPSMPVYLWNDSESLKYQETYFQSFPGVWRHGDWIEITEAGGCIIYGRSDSTIKRHGIRIGTSEIYRTVESIPDVKDSLAIDLEGLGGESKLLLFIVPNGIINPEYQKEVITKVKEKISSYLSKRHVPDEFYFIDDVPKTLNGKKLEVPIRKILMGVPLERAMNIGSVSNPAAIKFFVDLSLKRKKS